jgi:YbbR domain-containing protein
MQTRPPLRKSIIDNVFWFLIALGLSIFIWVTATTQSDPIETWRMVERVPIRFTPDPGLLITNQTELTTTAQVQLRSPRSVRQLMSGEDVQVWADLAGLGPGEHTIPLTSRVAPDRRATVINTSPSQITVTLELEASQLKTVEALVTTEPAPLVRLDAIRLDALQVLITGPASRVEQVAKAVLPLDLSNARSTFTIDIRPIPVDLDGQTVIGVNLTPAVIQVTVEISSRSDVRELRVLPDLIGQLPDGYVLAPSFDYEPTSIIVSGPSEVLATLPDTILTTPIDLSGRREDFVVEVTAQLPDPRLLILSGRTIRVSVGVTAPTTTRQFDRVPVEVIGLRDGLTVQLLPQEVTILVTGAQPLLATLTQSGIRVAVNLGALTTAGTYRVEPLASIDANGGLSISVLPDEIDVQIGVMAEATTESEGTDG